eukprot:792073-Prymnesium_polylepis.1
MCRARSLRSPPPSLIKNISARLARAALTPVCACVAVRWLSTVAFAGEAGKAHFPPPPTRPHCRSRGLRVRRGRLGMRKGPRFDSRGAPAEFSLTGQGEYVPAALMGRSCLPAYL